MNFQTLMMDVRYQSLKSMLDDTRERISEHPDDVELFLNILQETLVHAKNQLDYVQKHPLGNSLEEAANRVLDWKTIVTENQAMIDRLIREIRDKTKLYP
jgi:hypothetical protein